MESLTQKDQFERSKINLHAPDQMKCWAHALGVSKEELRKAVDKVRNSAAAPRPQGAVGELLRKSKKSVLCTRSAKTGRSSSARPDQRRAAGEGSPVRIGLKD